MNSAHFNIQRASASPTDIQRGSAGASPYQSIFNAQLKRSVTSTVLCGGTVTTVSPGPGSSGNCLTTYYGIPNQASRRFAATRVFKPSIIAGSAAPPIGRS
jgi:hypothetical protein